MVDNTYSFLLFFKESAYKPKFLQRNMLEFLQVILCEWEGEVQNASQACIYHKHVLSRAIVFVRLDLRVGGGGFPLQT